MQQFPGIWPRDHLEDRKQNLGQFSKEHISVCGSETRTFWRRSPMNLQKVKPEGRV